MSVLVVDDEEPFRLLMERRLGGPTHQVECVPSAEAALDRRLDGALTNRVRLGLYPGRLGTHEIFLDTSPSAKPGGAVVIGLGQVGELTPGALETGMAQAMLDSLAAVRATEIDASGTCRPARSQDLRALSA